MKSMSTVEMIDEIMEIQMANKRMDEIMEKQMASDVQIGGSHYKEMCIQPTDFIASNGLGWHEGNAVKYICRHHLKNGELDIDKAIHYLQLLKEFKYGKSHAYPDPSL